MHLPRLWLGERESRVVLELGGWGGGWGGPRVGLAPKWLRNAGLQRPRTEAVNVFIIGDVCLINYI